MDMAPQAQLTASCRTGLPLVARVIFDHVLCDLRELPLELSDLPKHALGMLHLQGEGAPTASASTCAGTYAGILHMHRAMA